MHKIGNFVKYLGDTVDRACFLCVCTVAQNFYPRLMASKHIAAEAVQHFHSLANECFCGYMKSNPVCEQEERITRIYKLCTCTLLWCHPLALFSLLFLKTSITDANHLTQFISDTERRAVCSWCTLPGINTLADLSCSNE